MDFFFDILFDTLKDAAFTLPFLFGAYLLIEFIEHRSSGRFEGLLKKFGAGVGAILGCVPQCGFSVAAANFYAERMITLGTLVAVFISTSDEALPLLVANKGFIKLVLPVMLIKVLAGLCSGVIIDLVARKKPEAAARDHHYRHDEQDSLLRSAILHTLNVLGFIVVFSLLLNLAIAAIGEQRLASLLMAGSLAQIPVAALIGFIPNCAASVMLTELFMSGSISFGALIAGLCTGAGTGLAVLFKENKNVKENLVILALLFATGVLAGGIVQLAA